MSDPTKNSPAVARRRLGTELRELRTGAGISIDAAAKALECSVSKISRLETGLGVPRSRDVRDLLRLIGGDAAARGDELLELAAAGQATPWFEEAYKDLLGPTLRRFLDLESGASEELVFGGAWVPGLLQTPSYTESLFRAFSPDLTAVEIGRRVELRMERKRVLDAGLKLTAIVDESVLLRSVGGPAVMRGQLQAFVDAIEDPFDGVELLFLPFSAGMHPILAGDLTVLRFVKDADVVLSEGHTAQGFEERTESVDEAVGVFESALKVAAPGTRFIPRLKQLIAELGDVESEDSQQPDRVVQVPPGQVT